MKWLVVVGGIMIIMTVFIALMIVRVELDYRRRDEEDALFMKASAVRGLIRFQRTFPLDKMSPSSTSEKEKHHRATIGNVMQKLPAGPPLQPFIVNLYRAIRHFLSHVRCQKLKWHSTIGTGDAAETGILTGLVWNLKSVTMGWGSHYLAMETTASLKVTPDFNRPCLDTHFTCIVKFRLGYAILTGCRILFHIKKAGFQENKEKEHRTVNETS